MAFPTRAISPAPLQKAVARGASVITAAAPSGGGMVNYEMKGPKPEKFKVASGQLFKVAAAAVPLLTRGGMGALTAGYSPSLAEKQEGTYTLFSTGDRQLVESSKISSFNRPAEPIIIYEFDACPFCKKVREMATYLDLDVLYKPCPQGGKVFRPEAVERSGKSMFPFMVDPNTGTEMAESDDIIQYLATSYGDGTVPLMLRLGVVTALTAGIGMIPRMGAGGRYRASNAPSQPVIIWGYEASPFVRLVKETLNELEIPHLFKNAARGSPKRQELFEQYGTYQVPFMQDPNTGTAMFESAAITQYLEDTYAVKA